MHFQLFITSLQFCGQSNLHRLPRHLFVVDASVPVLVKNLVFIDISLWKVVGSTVNMKGSFHRDLVLGLWCRLRSARREIRSTAITCGELWPVIKPSVMSENNDIALTTKSWHGITCASAQRIHNRRLLGLEHVSHSTKIGLITLILTWLSAPCDDNRSRVIHCSNNNNSRNRVPTFTWVLILGFCTFAILIQ